MSETPPGGQGFTAQTPQEEVLTTMESDGSHRWLAPRPSSGPFNTRRKVVGWGLITLFCALPYLRVGGKPAVFLDVGTREFTFFGATFLPTDSLLLMLLFISIFVGVFLMTAVLGRVWCGWACPQTVYMDQIFRPIERLTLGKFYRRRHQAPLWRHVWLHGSVLGMAAVLGHIFLAYFAGTEQLWTWMQQSPAQHPGGFGVMAATTALVYIDFAWFREQMCTLACPYGRFQSALLDKRSLIIGYDEQRGEPRGRPSAGATGDCVDCKACVVTCPTGIDIRRGLQMECVGCTQCIDACDTIMLKLDRPTGLIRYTSQDELATQKKPRLMRPRVGIYIGILVLLVTALLVVGLTRSEADVSIMRAAEPFSVAQNGDIENGLRIKITNRANKSRRFFVSLPGLPVARLVSPDLPVDVAPSAVGEVHLIVIVPPDAIPGSSRKVEVRINSEDGVVDIRKMYPLLGPRGGSR